MQTSNINTSYLEYNFVNGVKDVTDRELFTKTVSNKLNDTVMSAQDYILHLKEKYGSVKVKSVGKTQAELDAVGKAMGGSDVIIAPNMIEKMAANPELANAYETKIDAFFADEPRMQRIFAAKGLTYEVCGAVIHEDGTLTLICGGGDSPERVAEVNRINRERDEARALARKLYFQQSRQASQQRRDDYNAAVMKAYEEKMDIDIFYIWERLLKSQDFGMNTGILKALTKLNYL